MGNCYTCDRRNSVASVLTIDDLNNIHTSIDTLKSKSPKKKIVEIVVLPNKKVLIKTDITFRNN